MGESGEGDVVSWTRLVCDPGPFEKEDDGSFVELVRVENAIYERAGRIGAEKERVARRVLATAASAQKSLDKQIAALEKEGYAKDDPVSRPLPTIGNAREENAARRARGAAIFAELLPRFVAAYAALGFDPTKTFVEACVGKNVHPNKVASACIGVAAQTFGTGYTRWTYTYDQEHGKGMSVPARLLAEFYVRPAEIAALAREKLCGRNERHDDLDAHGLADEVELRIVALVKGLS